MVQEIPSTPELIVDPSGTFPLEEKNSNYQTFLEQRVRQLESENLKLKELLTNSWS